MSSRGEPNNEEQNHAIRISRNRQQFGLLCPVRLLPSNSVLRADDVLRADRLLQSGRLLPEHRLLRPAAGEE